MSVPQFPPELDRPLRDGFSLDDGETRRLFQPDAAPLVPRARYSSAARPVAMTLILDRNQLAIFDRFYNDELGRGARVFIMPDPTTEGWPLLAADGAPLLTADGRPILLAGTWLCLFGKSLPSRRPVGVSFSVSFTLGVLP